MSTARRGAFDPSLSIDDDILGPPPSQVVQLPAAAAEPARETPGESARQARTAQRASSTTEPVEAAPDVTAGRKAVAVRVPRPLYDEVVRALLSGAERPSYGQLVSWTVEDHPGDVLDLLERLRANAGTRAPRGRRMPADTVPLTLRLLPEELLPVDELIAKAGGPDAVVTRTALAIAALQVAVAKGPRP